MALTILALICFPCDIKLSLWILKWFLLTALLECFIHFQKINTIFIAFTIRVSFINDPNSLHDAWFKFHGHAVDTMQVCLKFCYTCTVTFHMKFRVVNLFIIHFRRELKFLLNHGSACYMETPFLLLWLRWDHCKDELWIKYLLEYLLTLALLLSLYWL